MKLNRVYRLMLLLATGGTVFQTTGCVTDLGNSLSASLQEAIVSAVNSAITTYLNQYLSGTA